LQSIEVSLSKSPIRAVLYDFDGTLADTTELVMNCYRHTMSTHLGQVPPDEEWLRGFGTPLEGQLARFARSAEERAAMLKTYEDFQDEHTHRLMVPFPGALETVEALKERGLPLAIVTSRYRESTIRGMDACGITRFFDLIIAPEDVHNPKPHPEPVLLALDRLGVAAAEAVFIGDSPHDMASGHSAGVRTGAALWGPFPVSRLEAEHPDFMLQRQEDVLDLVG
jgi:pyrophosphatase PpaX